jgi:hypothetical protein
MHTHTHTHTHSHTHRDALMSDDNAHYEDDYLQQTHSKLILAALCRDKGENVTKKRTK